MDNQIDQPGTYQLGGGPKSTVASLSTGNSDPVGAASMASSTPQGSPWGSGAGQALGQGVAAGVHAAAGMVPSANGAPGSATSYAPAAAPVTPAATAMGDGIDSFRARYVGQPETYPGEHENLAQRDAMLAGLMRGPDGAWRPATGGQATPMGGGAYPPGTEGFDATGWGVTRDVYGMARDEAGVTGYYGGAPTLARDQMGINALGQLGFNPSQPYNVGNAEQRLMAMSPEQRQSVNSIVAPYMLGNPSLTQFRDRPTYGPQYGYDRNTAAQLQGYARANLQMENAWGPEWNQGGTAYGAGGGREKAVTPGPGAAYRVGG